MKTPQVDPPWKWGVWNGNNVMLKKEDREAERYYEIWTDLVLSGMPTHEADIQADELLREEMENANI